MNITKLTLDQLKAAPDRKDWQTDEIIQSVIIIPKTGRKLHDSGYRLMRIVGVREKSIITLSVCSDDISLEGGTWHVECLPVSKCLHYWCRSGRIKAGSALSSLDLTILS